MGALKTGAGMMAAASLSRIGSRLAYGKSDSYKEGDDTENMNDTENSTQDTTKENTSDVEGGEVFDDQKVDTSAIEAVENSENVINPLEDPKDQDESNGENGENSGEKAPTGDPNDKQADGSQKPQTETPNGGVDKESGNPEVKDGENPPVGLEDSNDSQHMDGETPPNGSETPLQDPQTGETNDPQNTEGDNGQENDTSTGGPEPSVEPENTGGQLTDPVDENGNPIDQSNSTENLNNEIKESSLNNANSNDSTELQSSLEDNDLTQTGIEGASLVNQPSGDGKTGQTGKDGKNSENGGKETPAGSAPPDASKTPSSGQTPSGQPSGGKTGGGKNSGGKTSGGKSGENSKRNQRLGKESANPPGGVRGFFSVAKKAVGKGMMAAGGADHTQPLDKASTKGMFTAGLVHATAGLVGGQRFTTRYAQNRIDQRNESIVASGGQVRSNLSAIGETRMDAQRRMESRLNTSRIGQDVQSQSDYHAQMLEQQRETTMILKRLAGHGAVKPDVSSLDPNHSGE